MVAKAEGEFSASGTPLHHANAWSPSPVSGRGAPTANRLTPQKPVSPISPVAYPPLRTGICTHDIVPPLSPNNAGHRRSGGEQRWGWGGRTLSGPDPLRGARVAGNTSSLDRKVPSAVSAGCLTLQTISRRRPALSVRGEAFATASQTPGPHGRREPSAALLSSPNSGRSAQIGESSCPVH